MPKKPDMPCGVFFCPAPMRLLWPVKEIRVDDIATLYGRSRAEVCRRARILAVWDDRKHNRELSYSVAAFRRAWLDPAMTKPRIGAMFGMNKAQVWCHAQKLGLPARRTGRPPVYDFGPAFTTMWVGGVTAASIAAHFGCAVSLVSKEAKQRGLPGRKRGFRGGITVSDFRVRDGLAKSAAETRAAMADAEMLDFHRTDRRAA